VKEAIRLISRCLRHQVTTPPTRTSSGEVESVVVSGIPPTNYVPKKYSPTNYVPKKEEVTSQYRIPERRTILRIERIGTSDSLF